MVERAQRYYCRVATPVIDNPVADNAPQIFVSAANYARLEQKLAEIRALPVIPMLDDMDEEYGEALDRSEVLAILDRDL